MLFALRSQTIWAKQEGLLVLSFALWLSHAYGSSLTDLSSAHVFWDSTTASSNRSFKTSLCCRWTAEDARGMFVAEGKVTAGTVLLAPVASFGVGFYRFNFSEGGMTTAAVLRTPVLLSSAHGKSC